MVTMIHNSNRYHHACDTIYTFDKYVHVAANYNATTNQFLGWI